MEKNKISVDWCEEFELYRKGFVEGVVGKGFVEKKKYYRAYVPREVHEDGEWLIKASGFDELVSIVGKLVKEGDLISDVEDVFTQINEGAVFGKSERNNFSYVVDLGEGRRRQSYLFTLDELTRFRNELRKFYGKG